MLSCKIEFTSLWVRHFAGVPVVKAVPATTPAAIRMLRKALGILVQAAYGNSGQSDLSRVWLPLLLLWKCLNIS